MNLTLVRNKLGSTRVYFRKCYSLFVPCLAGKYPFVCDTLSHRNIVEVAFLIIHWVSVASKTTYFFNFLSFFRGGFWKSMQFRSGIPATFGHFVSNFQNTVGSVEAFCMNLFILSLVLV